MRDDVVSGRRDRLVHDAISSWRDDLVNLTRTNRLLQFRALKTSAVPVVEPDAGDIVRRLAAGTVFAFRGPAVEMSKEPELEPAAASRRGPGVLRTSVGGTGLSGALRNLLRRSHQEYLDRGLRILYLAVGTLEWADEGGMSYSSPLLLIPVELTSTGPRQLPHLTAAEDDPVLNPALVLKLGEMDIRLPGLQDLDTVDPAAVLAEVRRAVARRSGWRVADGVVLSYFTFAKEAMYRDLLDNRDRIAAHPAVVALAAGGRGEHVGDFGFDEIEDRDVDRIAPVDRTPLVLDADSSQRACIAAAVDGRSFVMDGPPGTGKSQTIANMIGALLHAGRTVLFVSEKAAALDVVRNRLADVGLDAYLLELHSSKATRKEVAAELGRSLSFRPVARDGMSGVDREQLRRRQEELNRYAIAMNEPRTPLDMSVHAVIGRLSELSEVPAAPRSGRPVAGLTPAILGEIGRTADDLARAWRPAIEGSSFLWRGARAGHASNARLQAAERSLDAVEELMRANQPVLDAFDFGGPSDAARLADLVEHYAARPSGVPEHWIVAMTAVEIDAALDRLAGRIDSVATCREQLTCATGVPWNQLPSTADLAVALQDRLADLDPAPLPIDRMTVRHVDEVTRRLRSDAADLATVRAALDDLAGLLRLPPARTFDDADRLLSVAAIATDRHRPEAAWFFPHERERAQRAVQHLAETARALDEAESAAHRFFDDAALDADAAGLDERFRTQHSGLRRMSGAYRQDKAVVAAFTRAGVAAADAQQNLRSIIEWQRAVADWERVAPSYQRDLGSYFDGRSTDCDRVQRLLDRAAVVARLFPDQDLRGVAAQVSANARTAPLLAHAAGAAVAALSGWRSAMDQVVEFGPRPHLITRTIDDVRAWIDAHVPVLASARAVVAHLDAVSGRVWSVEDARPVVALRESVDSAVSALDAEAADHRRLCGDLYDGVGTDLTALRAAAVWVRDLQLYAGGPLDQEQTHALELAVAAGSLRSAASDWRAKRADVVESFESFRHAELAEELDDADDARALLRALQRDTDGHGEWQSYQRAEAALQRHGLGETVAFCAREQLSADRIRYVIEKAVLAEWVEHHLGSDPALQPARARDRDAAVAEFRELDQRVVATAVGSIVDACNAHRPRNNLGGEAAVITRESMKKRGHMPVRELINKSRGVTQRIKPCFMMSPLAVSQFLPSDMSFDVVIFDEASQVAPMDAINCIYRGTALITAGDDKQLPPTSFFALAGDDDDDWAEEADDAADFESVLDLAKSSGAFRSLTLKWHYRSRHESLIAYSNSSFYDGKLITFPGADHEGPDVGVELIPVEGVYRRGSTRDNLIEARAVAERVLHHYDTRPGRSLGVVTFSEAQASLVETCVDEARRDRPDLDPFFTESRLDGFFVKNLESVQGDERDVMIFSIGYGPDEHGKLTMHFGPVGKSGGRRRLNVAITRARYRNEIVSSISAGDITASTNQELLHLRRYLDFAERGPAALALDTSTGGDAESPFEEAVINAVRSWGFEVTPQVGTAGYRIDLAVRHPDRPGVYVLGVECDGAQYHSSRVARDRDRLRDQVLTGLGWTMHRIWGTAWYHDRDGAERRLLAAIEAAVRAPVRGLVCGGPVELSPPPVALEEVEYGAVPDWAQPYTIAHIGPRPWFCEPHDPAAEPEMRKAVQEIVAVESPVHIDVLRQRLRDRWRIGQIGSRIRLRLDSAIRTSGVVRDGDFLHSYAHRDAAVRTPVEDCHRSVEQIHVTELEMAIVNLVRDSGGITSDVATVHVARLFGWARVGAEIRGRMAAAIEKLIADGTLARTGADLSVAAHH